MKLNEEYVPGSMNGSICFRNIQFRDVYGILVQVTMKKNGTDFKCGYTLNEVFTVCALQKKVKKKEIIMVNHFDSKYNIENLTECIKKPAIGGTCTCC